MKRMALATIATAMLVLVAEPVVLAAEDGAPEQSDHAADTPPASPDTATGGEKDESAVKRLGEVLVTATRREEPLRHVPMSVYVVDGDWLERRGARVPSDWMYSVPGLNYSSEGIGSQGKPTIRGIATNAGGFGESRPLTAVYFGDTPITYAVDSFLNANPWPELVDIDRIEILRGPQGNYFGANSMGGTIRIIPRAPDPNARSGYFGTRARAIEHGGFGIGVEGMANAPIAEGRGAVRVVGFDRHTDGFIDDTLRGKADVNDDHSFGGRLASTFRVTDRLDVDLGLDYERRNFGGVSGIVDDSSLALEQRHETPDSADDRWLLGSLGLRYHGDGFEVVSNTARFDRENALVLDITDFALPVYEEAFGGRTPVSIRFTGDQVDDFQELRAYSTGDGRWGWLAGVFAQHTRSRPDLTWFSPVGAALYPDLGLGDSAVLAVVNRLRLRQLASYGDLSYRPTGKVEVAAGGRLYRIEQDFDTSFDAWFGGDSGSLSSEESGFTPRFSARYDLDPRATLYANVAKGFRPGGGNSATAPVLPPECTQILAGYGLSGVPAEYDSDSLWSYEIGAKSSWFDRRLDLNVALYRIDWDDIQTQFVTECGGQNLVFNTNLGKARSQGVELDAIATPNEHLELELTAAYTDARYAETIGPVGISDGQRLGGVPYWACTAAATWRFDAPGAAVRLEYSHVGSRDVAIGQYRPLGAYGITNLRLTRRVGPAQLSLDLHNVFDQRVVLGFQNELAAVNVPRSVVLSVGFSY